MTMDVGITSVSNRTKIQYLEVVDTYIMLAQTCLLTTSALTICKPSGTDLLPGYYLRRNTQEPEWVSFPLANEYNSAVS